MITPAPSVAVLLPSAKLSPIECTAPMPEVSVVEYTPSASRSNDLLPDHSPCDGVSMSVAPAKPLVLYESSCSPPPPSDPEPPDPVPPPPAPLPGPPVSVPLFFFKQKTAY